MIQPSVVPPFKLIFKGRLEFGNQRTFDMVVKHWQVRLETYFKSDVLFKSEQVLIENEFALVIALPQVTVQATDKAWRATTDMLREVVQFAIVGRIQAWRLHDGRLIDAIDLQPHSDKTAVAEYWLGCELVKKEGMEEAAKALSRAIDKYQRHALAYERRGYVNYKLRNFNDALYDFSKSIDINPNNPEPYYSRAKVQMLKNEWEQAAADCDMSIKRSIPLQPIYWLSRMRKGECLMHAKQYDAAIAEFQLFLKRNFGKDDPNFNRRRKVWYMIGKCLMGRGEAQAALEAFNQSLAIREGADLLPESEALLNRGIAGRQAGRAEYAKDLAAAAEMGSIEAARLLAEWGA